MTTASRVSDSRVTDAMFDAALSTWYLVLTKDKRADMRAAFEAALACQGPVTYVVDLEEVVRREGIYAGHLKKEEVVVPINFLYALIAKANGHE